MKLSRHLILLAFALVSRGARADVSAPATGPAPEQSPRGRPLVIVMGVVPLATALGPKGPRGSEVISFADRFSLAQIAGAGYVVNPSFRVALVGLFGETSSGLPPGASAWQLGGIAPIAMATLPPVVIGGGPIIAYRSGGEYRADVGGVLLPGASLPLGRDFALNVVAPITALFVNRVAVSFGIGVGMTKVF